MFEKLTNVLKVAFVIIGTLVGAGFASGKEIYSFFFIYGQWGAFGIAVSSVIIGLIIYKVLHTCCEENVDNYYDFCEIIGGRDIGNGNVSTFLNSIVNIFLVIVYFIMIAGFSGFMKQEFNVNGYLASSVIVTICYFIFLKNVNGLIKISNFLIPVLIFFIVFISIKISDINSIKLTIKYISCNRASNNAIYKIYFIFEL